ncbi:MAG TPA: hypothetical protein VFE47_22940 [Tepidisphaeraceae bacterium]|jgi:hypothetical protein|nr:hypothetical protein [Tepidisphaeraceae bacterium]
MPDDTSQKRSLSEISHLFLSSVRDKQTNGAPRPQRIPPGQARLRAEPVDFPVQEEPVTRASVDLSPEELATVFREPVSVATNSARPERAQAPKALGTTAPRRMPPVTAVLGAHLNGRQFDRVKEYARHLASTHGRVGLIELDAAELRLMSFEAGDAVLDPDLDEPESCETSDLQEAAEALEEMNCDVAHWLLLVPNPRTPEARALLGSVGHWVLLSTCDHDGVVSSYRLLKGLAESYRPRLSLSLLNGVDKDETDRVYRKLSGVCQQFLNWNLEDEPAVQKSTKTIEHLVLCCRPTRDKGQIAAAPQWGVISNFLQSVTAGEANAASAQSPDNQEELDPMHDTSHESFEASSAAAAAEMPAPFAPFPRAQTAHPFGGSAPQPPAGPRLAGPSLVRDNTVDVIDLPMDAGPESILTAILQQNHGELVECPVRAPMCDGARLAITRDRRIVLVAISRTGLSDLRAIGQAYRWISENRALIAMAIPQFSIDTRNAPRLRLLVDHSDVSADLLQPILHSEHVTIQAYRKIRWGGRMGLFLEAA